MGKTAMTKRSVMETGGCLTRHIENFSSVLARLRLLRECLKEIQKDLVVNLRKPLWRQRRRRRLNIYKKMIPVPHHIRIFADQASAKKQIVESSQRLKRSLRVL